MHVLPLPFGLALAVLPRREAAIFRKKSPIKVFRGPSHRERILGDIRYSDSRQHVL